MKKLPTYSFCESVHAGSSSRWHIRVLSPSGQHFGGGVTTPSLCGLVKPPLGWDLKADVTDPVLLEASCVKCHQAYREMTRS
jgi:hypothetical protein